MERSEPGHRPEINSAIYSPTDVVLELSGEVENRKSVKKSGNPEIRKSEIRKSNPKSEIGNGALFGALLI